ncbi:MAG: YiiD C-terminal domain-containing protein [Ktedonobacterales bacterium]|nr:YiiD C-terminal domain-containing protein [Ktedonobacterales bacterium]
MDMVQALLEAVPFAKSLGIEIVAYTPNEVKLRLPLRPDLTNHMGTMHAAAQYALAETASGALNLLIFGEQLGNLLPLNRSAQIEYRRPSRGTLIAHGELGDEALQQVRDAFAAEGRAKFSTAVALYDESDLTTIVTTVTIEWVILKQRSK